MSCVVRWWDVLFVKGMHFSSKNARLLNCLVCGIRFANIYQNEMAFIECTKLIDN